MLVLLTIINISEVNYVFSLQYTDKQTGDVWLNVSIETSLKIFD